MNAGADQFVVEQVGVQRVFGDDFDGIGLAFDGDQGQQYERVEHQVVAHTNLVAGVVFRGNAVAPLVLGPVQRLVGALHQLIEMVHGFGVQLGDADAQGDERGDR